MYNDHLGAASIPHAPHQEWRHAGAESWADERDPGATRAKRCATIILVKRLQKEVEELQERNSLTAVTFAPPRAGGFVGTHGGLRRRRRRRR